MNYNDLRYFIYADFFREHGFFRKRSLLKLWFFPNANGAKYLLFYRICQYFENRKTILKFLRIILRKYQIKFGISIDPKTKIGEGLSIPHCGAITVAGNAVIGRNCTILQGVTIGSNLFKSRFGAAKIGDNVLIGSGAKIIGPVKIGNNVTIGANSVVVKDIPDDVVVAGAPASVISIKKAIEVNCDYLVRKDFLSKQ